MSILQQKCQQKSYILMLLINILEKLLAEIFFVIIQKLFDLTFSYKDTDIRDKSLKILFLNMILISQLC